MLPSFQHKLLCFELIYVIFSFYNSCSCLFPVIHCTNQVFLIYLERDIGNLDINGFHQLILNGWVQINHNHRQLVGMLALPNPGPRNSEPLLGAGIWSTMNRMDFLTQSVSPARGERSPAERLSMQLLRAHRSPSSKHICLNLRAPPSSALLGFISWKPEL